MTNLLDAMHPSISNAINLLLSQDFQASEIAQALKQMHSNTRPGPDALPPLFYQSFGPLLVVMSLKLFLTSLIMVLFLPSLMTLILFLFQGSKF